MELMHIFSCIPLVLSLSFVVRESLYNYNIALCYIRMHLEKKKVDQQIGKEKSKTELDKIS
jgi:hypothetical protein